MILTKSQGGVLLPALPPLTSPGPETIEDAEQRTVTFGYDDANRVTSTLLPDGNAEGFAYDENGNVIGVTPPGKSEHVFTYSRRNQLETYVLPDAGEGTATEVRTYDESKRLKEVQRPGGKLITFAFKPARQREDGAHVHEEVWKGGSPRVELHLRRQLEPPQLHRPARLAWGFSHLDSLAKVGPGIAHEVEACTHWILLDLPCRLPLGTPGA